MPIDRIGRHRESGMDGDKTGNRERNVGKTWGTFIAKGIAIAVLYGIAYLALRYISFNQWFLPAGLRAACLLFMPYRYWLFLFLGEAGITLYKKIEMVDLYGHLWVYLSSILLAPFTAIAPLLVRRQFGSIKKIVRWAPLIASFIALWSSFVKTAMNYSLYGPKQPEDFSGFVVFVIGDYLGILMIMLPYLLFRMIRENDAGVLRFARGSLLAAAAITFMCLAIEVWPPQDGLLQHTMLMLMCMPSILLTYYYGWKGAAVGVLLANLGVAQAMTYTGIQNAHDSVVFYSQIWLVTGSIILLIFGAKFSSQYEKAKKSGFAEKEALNLARMSLLSNEPVLRDQLICMAQLQVLMDEERDQLAKELRANGKNREALQLNSRGVEQRQLFEEQALVLYPIGIERHGLYEVIDTPLFRESRASGVTVDIEFGRVDPRTLSEDLQVLAYRCLCHAMDHLSDWEPSHFRLQLRAWHGRERRGIYVSVSITTSYQQDPTPYGESAALLLDARVKASGGVIHRKPDGIRLLLSESNQGPAARL